MKRNTIAYELVMCAASAAILLIFPACRTTVHTPDYCPVMASSDGTVQVEGKACRMEDIPAQLKSAGFSTDTMIRVSVPDNVQRDTLSKLSSVLASEGYTRFLFVKPLLKESVAKGTDGQSGQKSPARQPSLK